jgi:hypothetical protein
MEMKLYREGGDKTTLELVDAKTTSTGVTVHTYERAGTDADGSAASGTRVTTRGARVRPAVMVGHLGATQSPVTGLALRSRKILAAALFEVHEATCCIPPSTSITTSLR